MPALPPPWLLHPMAVHYPIALLTMGLAAGGVAILGDRPPWLARAAAWLLWLGSLSAWAALGLGLLAEETVPHVPAAWKTLSEHEALAWWTAGLFTGLSALRFWLDRRERPRAWEAAFLAAWLAAAGVLIATAYHGGELVFTFGVGRVPSDAQ